MSKVQQARASRGMPDTATTKDKDNTKEWMQKLRQEQNGKLKK